jgi:glucokinase
MECVRYARGSRSAAEEQLQPDYLKDDQLRILTGDVGGTKTRLALLQPTAEGHLELLNERYYRNAGYAALEPLLQVFLDSLEILPDAAGFSLAGPVQGRLCRLTNLPWSVDADALERQFRIPRVILLNDLEATAWGIGALPATDFHCLQQGHTGAPGNRAVIAAGTGLGEAGLFWNGRRHQPFATEGGHCNFAPGDEFEFALFEFLRERYGHVSWERVLSGPGLVDLFEFLVHYRKARIGSQLRERMEAGDPAAAIAGGAAEEQDPICREAMQRFTRLYGVECGNQALKLMATGGVYIGGGIAPKIIDWLRQPVFIEAFREKGAMRPLMEAIPVNVIMNERTALLGPAVRLVAE